MEVEFLFFGALEFEGTACCHNSLLTPLGWLEGLAGDSYNAN